MLVGRKNLVVVKGMKHQEEAKKALEMHKEHELNPIAGFRCLHYSVTESAGTVKIVILRKTEEDISNIGVRTVDDTAVANERYHHIDKPVQFAKGQKEAVVEVEIIDDDQWEPDEDFLVELYDLNTKERLEGKDSVTRVTTIDDDQPGILSFS